MACGNDHLKEVNDKRAGREALTGLRGEEREERGGEGPGDVLRRAGPYPREGLGGTAPPLMKEMHPGRRQGQRS